MRLPLTTELLPPDGHPSAAVTTLISDIGLTTSVVAGLPDLRGVTTVTMTVEHLAAPPRDGALLVTCKAAPFVEDAALYCSGAVTDAGGRTIARVSGWFLPTEPAPGERERVGRVVEPPARDLWALLGAACAGWDLVAREGLSNALGTLHGGVGALAVTVAALDRFDPEMRLVSSSFHYLRPTPRHGTVRVGADIVRSGRRTAVATGTLTGPDGKTALSSTHVAVQEPATNQRQA